MFIRRYIGEKMDYYKKAIIVCLSLSLFLILFSHFVSAVAPDQITSPNSPADGSTGHGQTVILNVTPTDQDSNSMNVTFNSITWIEDTSEDSVSCSGTWDETHNCSFAKDDDWSTYGSTSISGGTGYIYFNYTKLSGSVSAKWEVKDYEEHSVTTVNLTINPACFSQSPLQLRARSYDTGSEPCADNCDYAYWDCYNGTDWINLRTAVDGFRIYEQKIWWENYTNLCTNTSVSNNTEVVCEWSGLSSGTTYNWCVNVSDGVDSTISSTWNFTTNTIPVVSSRAISTTSPVYATDNVDINVTAYDIDSGQTITCYYNIYNDNTVRWSGSKVVSNDTATTLITINSTDCSAGTTLIGEIWCGDSYENTTKGNTSTATWQKATATATFGVTPASPQTYETSITPYCSCNNPENPTMTFTRNGTAQSNNTAITLGADIYDFDCSFATTENYTSCSDLDNYYTINKKDANVVINPSTQTINYGSSVNQYCLDDSSFYDCSIYRNESSVSNNTVVTLGVGVYNYVANITDTYNYTNYQATSTLTVDKATPPLKLEFNGTEGNSTIGYNSVYLNVTGSCNITDNQDLTFNLYNSTALLNSGDPSINITTFSVGEHKFTFNTSGGANYTSNSVTYYASVWNVTEGTPTQNTTLSNIKADNNYNVTWKTVINFSNPATFSGYISNYNYTIPSTFTPYDIVVKNSTNGVISSSSSGNYVWWDSETLTNDSANEIVYWVCKDCVSVSRNEITEENDEYELNVTLSDSISGYPVSVDSLIINITSAYDYSRKEFDLTVTRNGTAVSYGVNYDETGDNYDYVTISNQVLSSSYVYNLHITPTPESPSGGGGGGGTPSPVCGNGICETGEDEYNCPEDCLPKTGENTTYIVSPDSVTRFVKENKEYTQDFIIYNPNPQKLAIKVAVKCVKSDGEYDPSCKWTKIIVDDKEYDEYTFILPEGNEKSPSTTKFIVKMTTPEDIPIRNYRTNIVFRDGVTRVVNFELKTFIFWNIIEDFLNIHIPFKRNMPLFGDGFYVWHGIIIIIIIASAVKISKRKKKRRRP